MAQITKSNGSLTTNSLRRIAGFKCKRKSAFNVCIGAALKDKSYGKVAPGTGGRQDKRIQQNFADAARRCVGKKPLSQPTPASSFSPSKKKSPNKKTAPAFRLSAASRREIDKIKSEADHIWDPQKWNDDFDKKAAAEKRKKGQGKLF